MSPVNALNIANTFKSVSNVQNITDKTVSVYLEYMQDAFLIEKSERYDIKGRKYIGSLSKYYYQDIGLRNSIISFRQTEPTYIMENVIYNEMRMRGWLVDVGNVAQRVRNDKGQNIRVTLEVDFVCNKGSQRIFSICQVNFQQIYKELSYTLCIFALLYCLRYVKRTSQ